MFSLNKNVLVSVKTVNDSLIFLFINLIQKLNLVESSNEQNKPPTKSSRDSTNAVTI